MWNGLIGPVLTGSRKALLCGGPVQHELLQCHVSEDGCKATQNKAPLETTQLRGIYPLWLLGAK